MSEVETALKVKLDGVEKLVREMQYVRYDLRRFCECINEWSSTFCTAVATFEKAYDSVPPPPETAPPPTMPPVQPQPAAPSTAAQPIPAIPTPAAPVTAMPQPTPAPIAPAVTPQPAAMPPPVSPTMPPQPVAAAPMPAPVPPPPPHIPTAQISYTLDQLTKASAELMDAGGDVARAQLQKLVLDLGSQGLSKLPPEKYSEYAARLRALGGKI